MALMTGLLTLSLICCSPQDLSITPPDDPRLAARLSMHDCFLTVGEVAARLESATNARITVGPSLRDRKVVAVFNQIPAREVMTRLAELMLGSWRVERERFVLDLT